MYGSDCFLNGILCGWLVGHFEAFANFGYWGALMLLNLGKARQSIIFSSITLLLAMQTFTLHEINRGYYGTSPILGYGLGFYLWLLSFLLFFVYLLLRADGILHLKSIIKDLKAISLQRLSRYFLPTLAIILFYAIVFCFAQHQR